MSTTLERPPGQSLQQRTAVSPANVLKLCRKLEDIRDQFVEVLPRLDDKTIDAVRMGAKAVSVWAWVVECACDAEILDRAEAKKGGRGRKDEEGQGKVAAAGQKANEDAKSVRTVYRNAQIINTFGVETIATHGKTLQDKGFWIAALDAPDPVEAIEVFAEKKTATPSWEVRDAHREVDAIKGKHETAKRAFSEKVTTFSRKAACEWLRFTAEPELDKLATSCTFPMLAKIFRDAQQECREAADALFLDNAQECVLYIWSKGKNTVDQLVNFTCLPRVEILRVLEALAEKGYFVEKPRAWKTKQGRGTRIMEWHRTEKPLPLLHIDLPTGPLNLDLN